MVRGEEGSEEEDGQRDVEEEVEERPRMRILNSMRSRVTALCCAYLIGMLVVGGASTHALQVILRYEVRKGNAPLGGSSKSLANASTGDLHVLFNQTYLYGTGSYWIVQTSDGGYLIGGTNSQSPSLVKIDWRGEGMWTRTYWDDAYPSPYGYRTAEVVVEADNGDFLILGRARPPTEGIGNQDDLFLLRVDGRGNALWNRTLRCESPTWKSDKERWREDVGGVVSSQNGFLIVGSVFDAMYERGVCFVMEIDEEGNKLWERNLSLQGSCGMLQAVEGSGGLVRSPEGGYYFVTDGIVRRLDEYFDEQWSKQYCKDKRCTSIQSIIPHPEGGFVIAGRRNNATTNRADSYVARLDLNGDVVWESLYGEPNINEWGGSVAATGDGFVVVGSKDLEEGFVLKVGLEGSKVWDLSFDTVLTGVVPSYEGGFIAITWDWRATSFYEGEPPSRPIPESPAILGSIAMFIILIMAAFLGVAFLSRRSRPED